jgi:hypothetical protein
MSNHADVTYFFEAQLSSDVGAFLSSHNNNNNNLELIFFSTSLHFQFNTKSSFKLTVRQTIYWIYLRDKDKLHIAQHEVLFPAAGVGSCC